MTILSKEQVIQMHEALIISFGGEHGLRDEALLESALSSPFQSFENEEAFPSLYQKSARLCYGLIKNHAFFDGNKRIGAHCLLVFHEQDDFASLILGVADGSVSLIELIDWIVKHQKSRDN